MANPFYVQPGGDYGQALQGLGSSIAGYREARDEKEKERKMVERFNTVKTAMSDAYNSGDPDALAKVTMEYPEAQKTVELLYGFKNDQTKANALETYRSVLANKDNPSAALDAINSRIQFVESQGGDPSTVTLRARDSLQNIIQSGQDPSGFFKGAEMDYAAIASPQEWKAYSGAGNGGMTLYQQERLALDRERLNRDAAGTANQKDWATYQRLKKEDPVAAEDFGRASGFVSKEGQELTSFGEKQLAAASDEYTTASNAVSRYKGLSDQLRKADMSGGLKSKWTEYVKEQTGNQDEVTALRNEARQIVNSEAIKNLPPGPATDRDIQIVMAPFPTEKSSPKYVANWLDSMARLNQKRAEYAEFKADFIAKNGSLRDQGGNSLASAWKQQQVESQAKKPVMSKYQIEVMD